MITKVAARAMVVWIAMSALLLGLCEKLHADITLARGGQSNYTIVIDRPDESGLASERHGAEELQMFLKQICGAKLPIVIAQEKEVTGPKILVGRSKALERLPVKIDLKPLGDEGFVMKTVGKNLVLAGGRGRGTMYACYEFLYKYLGCRWFTPQVSRIPRLKTILLPAIDYRKIPALEYRDIFYKEAWDGDWSARNHVTGINSRLGPQHGGKLWYHNEHFVHTLIDAVPPEKYFQEHPEYFALNAGDGKRYGRKGQYDQVCLTNPDVVRIVTESVRQWLRDEPECDIVDVSEGDLSKHCECANCRALVDREGGQAGPILHFVNQIADKIKEEFPTKAVGTLAYQASRKPPKYVRPRPHVVIRLVSSGCCVFHPLATCDSDWSDLGVITFRKDIVGWSKICNRLHVWNYVANYGDCLIPWPNLYVLGPNIKFFVDHKVKGIFEQGIASTAGSEFAELRSYILARCLWDARCDWQKVMNEFLEAYYGSAAKPIRRYIDVLHQKVQSGNIHSQGPATEYLKYLTPDVIHRADKLFDEAEAAVADDPVLLGRVKKERLAIELFKIYRQKELLPSWREYEAAVDRFERIARECGISNLSDYGRPLEEEVKKWREELQISKKAEEK